MGSLMREKSMGWRVKRRLVPGGLAGVFEEVALSEQHIRVAGNPTAPIRSLIDAPQQGRCSIAPPSSEG
jgi:hypothetical protein